MTPDQIETWRANALMFHEASGFSGLTLSEFLQLPAEKQAVMVLAGRDFRRKVVSELALALMAPAAAAEGEDLVEALKHEQLVQGVRARVAERKGAPS